VPALLAWRVTGQQVYDQKCAGCHKLGTYDTAVAGPAEMAPLAASILPALRHKSITLAATDITNGGIPQQFDTDTYSGSRSTHLSGQQLARSTDPGSPPVDNSYRWPIPPALFPDLPRTWGYFAHQRCGHQVSRLRLRTPPQPLPLQPGSFNHRDRYYAPVITTSSLTAER
jgi:hypothetical protein